ncbi:hypothetical protein D0817_20325 [Flavobacterium cupreum]|uniref:Helix-turn-helix domain-containing protein n=1 Tax=Flavobacterium cupreum TaxID=2133766 RepID=A0A434A279_9FLAO|nr:hypothetical protein D0817_20325 [Flavobacterium cupreum]
MKAVLGYEKGQARAARELGIVPSLMTKWRQEFLEFGVAGFCGRGSAKLSAEKKKLFRTKKKT